MPVVDIKRVMVCDSVDPACVELLRKHGIEVVFKLKRSQEELCQEVKNFDAAIVRSDTKITAEILQAGAGKLKVVGRAGAGVDNINVPAATANKVMVLNTPGGNSISACELTCILIGALARPIIPASKSLKEGNWERKMFTGSELYGKTLAILGLGRIGREVGMRMKVFGMRVIGYDPITTESEAQAYGIEKMELKNIWPLADYITVHTPLIPATRNLVSIEELSKCKTGVKLVNVARGGIIDEKAIVDAVETGKCAGAALDVYSEEPPQSDLLKRLISNPNVIAVPHLGASTPEAQTRVAIEVAEQFLALTGASPKYLTYPGLINKEVLTHYQ